MVQVRAAVLAEIGTHAVLDAGLGGYRDGERRLAYPLARSTGVGDLVIAGRGTPEAAALTWEPRHGRSTCAAIPDRACEGRRRVNRSRVGDDGDVRPTVLFQKEAAA
ncbi:hypothetical protein ACPCBX_25505 [Streptomyces tuirus]|nr:hypothetical protein [Streptomyces tuirus]